MKIRYKILTYISLLVIPVIAIAFVFIYISFYEYREEEFQQQQYKKIKTTIKLIEQFKDQSAEVSNLLDKQDINDFYDEKLRIFDADKQKIFSSLDNLKIQKSDSILNLLSEERTWIETKEDKYDLIGVYYERKGVPYYGISKAFDVYGHTKLEFLRNVLLSIFFLISLLIVFISIYIARLIARPISKLERTLVNYDLEADNYLPISLTTSTVELQNLTSRFNELLSRANESFKFQKHTINHISHQLKTPISILVTELEKIENQTENVEIKKLISLQKIKAQSLGNIINVLLEISKIETGQSIQTKKQRIDELIFDSIGELKMSFPDFQFDINYLPESIAEEQLFLEFNAPLMKQALLNLLTNAATYSDKKIIEIQFIAAENLSIKIINSGKRIRQEEEKFLFKHFFRGENSDTTNGQGLGLILTKKIIDFHKGKINYMYNEKGNVFTIELNA